MEGGGPLDSGSPSGTVVHVFKLATRSYHRLERIWGEAPTGRAGDRGRGRVRRSRTALLGLLASLLWAAPAGAFTSPEIYVRLAHANSTDPTPASGWMPLSAAPHLDWLGGYEIGYAFEDAPGPGQVQRAALQVTGVPDGQPTQPLNTPYCSGGPGTIGAIVPVGMAIPGGARGGEGTDLRERLHAPWRLDVRGARVRGGLDDNFNDVVFGTPWSAPVRLDVRSDFRSSKREIFKPRSKHPLLRFTAEFPEAASGETGKLELRRLARCRGTRLVLKTAGTFRGRFDARGRATVKVRRPPAGFYVGILSFSGTRFYTKSVDPSLALLGVSDKGQLSYVSPSVFPQCPGFR
jgi:hypothetical protein